MSIYHVAIAIPIFFFLLGLEWYISQKKQKVVYNFRDSVLNISCGIIERGMNLLFYLIMFVFYYWLYNEYRMFTFDQSHFLTWTAALILLDFIYYWHHRFSHEINVLWGAHVAHHSSNEFNGTVAFRNSFVPLFIKLLWWVPLPVLGFSPQIIFTMVLVNGLYQFILHNRFIGKLGWLEYILVTPSSHRVHHGSNAKYLDKNYGAVFIIWDRLFGTFTPEEEEPEFGLTKKLVTQNPITVYVHHWVDLIRLSQREKSWKKRMQIWFGRPSRIYAENPDYYANTKPTHSKVKLSKSLVGYIVVQLMIALSAVMLTYLWRDFTSIYQKWWIAACFMISGISISLLLEQKSMYFRLEQVRLLFLAGTLGFFLPTSLSYWLAGLLMIVLSLIWITWLHKNVKQSLTILYNP